MTHTEDKIARFLESAPYTGLPSREQWREAWELLAMAMGSLRFLRPEQHRPAPIVHAFEAIEAAFPDKVREPVLCVETGCTVDDCLCPRCISHDAIYDRAVANQTAVNEHEPRDFDPELFAKSFAHWSGKQEPCPACHGTEGIECGRCDGGGCQYCDGGVRPCAACQDVEIAENPYLPRASRRSGTRDEETEETVGKAVRAYDAIFGDGQPSDEDLSEIAFRSALINNFAELPRCPIHEPITEAV